MSHTQDRYNFPPPISPYLIFPALFAVCYPVPAHAHALAAEVHGFMHGLVHPLGGLDHVCAMLAVGLWAAQMGGRAVWRLPACFVVLVALGGLLGMAAVPVPFIEDGIAMSLLLTGVLIAAAVRPPVPVSAAIIGVFAVFHGYAHGVEMPPDVFGLEYAAGFMLAAALLNAAGIAVAMLAKNHGRARWMRLAGAAVALCGGILFVG